MTEDTLKIVDMKSITTYIPPCDECGSEVTRITVPEDTVLLRIPFTAHEVIIRNWNAKETHCAYCDREKHQAPFDEAYDAGVMAGHQEAYEESLRNR